uniref:Uncharacterized protein n=1 Tax=Leersia perrieri TaxID=77586 RepID=A0A0D9X8M5_9ORYZ
MPLRCPIPSHDLHATPFLGTASDPRRPSATAMPSPPPTRAGDASYPREDAFRGRWRWGFEENQESASKEEGEKKAPSPPPGRYATLHTYICFASVSVKELVCFTFITPTDNVLKIYS